MAHSDDNQYKRLPVVLQTTAIKNFFEYTVDQLYSEANVETLNGFVGTPDYDGIRAEGAYIEEPTTTKQTYALTPTVNTISPETGEPESLVYYDEVVDNIEGMKESWKITVDFLDSHVKNRPATEEKDLVKAIPQPNP